MNTLLYKKCVNMSIKVDMYSLNEGHAEVTSVL